MNPKQKALNDRVISVLTMSLLGLFVLIVIIFIISEVNLAKRFFDTTETPTLASQPLSSDEVDEQRLFLPPNEIMVSDSGDTIVLQPALPSEASVSVVNESLVQKPLDARELTFEARNGNVQPKTAYVSAGTQVVPISVGTRTQPEPTQSRVIEGTVSKLDGDTLVVTSRRSQLYVINTSAQTRIMINGRMMNVEDVEVGDILRVEGRSLPDASTLVATAIAIIGKTEIINLR